jgi:hypothetical protein
MPVLVLFGCSTLVTACRVHDLQDGRYALTMTQVVRDDCALESMPGIFTTGTLRTTGDVVRLKYDLFDIELNGTYATAVERMSLDGSVNNLPLHVNGVDCLIDLVVMHLDANGRSATAFDGFVSVSLETQRPDACVCQLWAGYNATLAP